MLLGAGGFFSKKQRSLTLQIHMVRVLNLEGSELFICLLLVFLWHLYRMGEVYIRFNSNYVCKVYTDFSMRLTTRFRCANKFPFRFTPLVFAMSSIVIFLLTPLFPEMTDASRSSEDAFSTLSVQLIHPPSY